ncbi:hemolysin-III family protein [Schizosaccharomyces japonicus yFS275]|uniref:Hemolysin-III family protein n=1 Tax=Schizosaccharomyces japonicus (strain yFS275 / FY16936) TaxID=402676 RepID=B6JZN8_SCHJY|nr:hemolysin-III family protein [Schizosaccharomyces japonicus yFS275]EEB07006.1 hemolysin-III family protein [Schizosaccharomyces japonicus yFS275]
MSTTRTLSVPVNTATETRGKNDAKIRRNSYVVGRGRDDEVLEDFVMAELSSFLTRLGERLQEIRSNGASFQEGSMKTVIEFFVRVHEYVSSDTGVIGTKQVASMLQLVEEKYHDILDACDTFPKKAQAALTFMERRLADLERSSARSLQNVDSMLSDATEMFSCAIKMGTRRLLTIDEVPVDWQNNPYILRGYRFYQSKRRCVKSILSWHNETVNIWSHMLGMFVFAGICLFLHPNTQWWTDLPLSNRLIALVFLLAAVKCLACSTIWHTFASLANLKAMHRAACMDYLGISVLIAASIMSVEFYGFSCFPKMRNVFLFFTGSLGVIGIYTPWKDWFNDNKYRHVKIAFFVGLACSGFAPLLTMIHMRGFYYTMWILRYVMYSIACYCFGVTLYAFNFPERAFPGVFDNLGNSHQWWHFMIVCGVSFQYCALKHFERGENFVCNL